MSKTMHEQIFSNEKLAEKTLKLHELIRLDYMYTVECSLAIKNHVV